MRNLNLYNCYDKSLADINRDYLTSKNAKKEKNGAGGKSKSLALVLLAAVILAVPAGIYLGHKLSETTQETILAPAPPKPDLRSTEEKLGYVKVQIFEFADEAPETAAAPAPAEKEQRPAEITAAAEKTAEKAPEKTAAKGAEKEKPRETPAPAKKEPAPRTETAKAAVPAKAAEKRYSVTFEGIDPKEYDTVNSLALKYKFTPEITDSSSISRTLWRVYRMEPSSKTVIGGKNVEKVKDFATKEEAVAYAKENNIQSVIRLEEEVDKTYALRLCCGDLESSKKLAEASNIRNKTIKIVREK